MTTPSPSRRSVLALTLATYVLIIAAGCAGTTFRSISYLDRRLRPLPDSVTVNTWPTGMSLPDRPYIVVGEVYAQRAATTVMGHIDRQQLLEQLRSEARKLGADGIVSMLQGSAGVTWRQVDQGWFWGVAILYVDRWVDREATELRRRQLEEQARQRLPFSRT